jgi:hypothetical protein
MRRSVVLVVAITAVSLTAHHAQPALRQSRVPSSCSTGTGRPWQAASQRHRQYLAENEKPAFWRGFFSKRWLRGRDLNPRPLGYEPNELPDCSTPRQKHLL